MSAFIRAAIVMIVMDSGISMKGGYPMRFTIIASAACVGVTLLGLTGSGTSRTTAAQPQAPVQEVDPKIVAFIKPVEITDGDSELQKKLKERHNVAVRLLAWRSSLTVKPT